ncbi:MAG: AraC family transcriptional regulator [Bacteroidales bacterium]|nr:AraC family transcriptional regulator [Bacteroidales bacterium]
MEIFIVSAAATAILLLAGVLLVRNLRYRALATMNRWYGAWVMISCSVLMVCDLFAGGAPMNRIPLDVMIALVSLSTLTNTFMTLNHKKVAVFVNMGISLLLSIYYILCAAGVFSHLSSRTSGIIALIISLYWVTMFACSIGSRVRNIQALMQSGTVWTLLCLSVDAFYAVALVFLMALYSAFHASIIICVIVLVLLFGMLAAFGSRMASDSVFAIFQRHERRIVESMRISPVESASGVSGEENMYKELYDRIQTYFDEEKPFLNGNLTINDVVARVFSNKVYISRAIGQYTGRNFCQYVNYHRVMFAMECFRHNTELKISELWPLCGFNTIVSFNMAFRLFMDENPSEWCRKEKIRLSKKKK